jgi:hypothetical protein
MLSLTIFPRIIVTITVAVVICASPVGVMATAVSVVFTVVTRAMAPTQASAGFTARVLGVRMTAMVAHIVDDSTATVRLIIESTGVIKRTAPEIL